MTMNNVCCCEQASLFIKWSVSPFSQLTHSELTPEFPTIADNNYYHKLFGRNAIIVSLDSKQNDNTHSTPNSQITVTDDVLFTVFIEENSTMSTHDHQQQYHNHQNISAHSAVFPGGSAASDKAYNSAICVYSMKAIRRKFMQNIKQCFNGVGQRGLDFLSPNMNCVPTRLQTLNEDFCGLDVNSPLGGEIPIAAVPIHVYHGQRLTGAILTDDTNGAQVLFTANTEGQLMKLIFDEKQQQVVEYDRIDISESVLTGKR